MLISEIISSNIYQVQIRIRVYGAPTTTWIEITAPSKSAGHGAIRQDQCVGGH